MMLRLRAGGAVNPRIHVQRLRNMGINHGKHITISRRHELQLIITGFNEANSARYQALTLWCLCSAYPATRKPRSVSMTAVRSHAGIDLPASPVAADWSTPGSDRSDPAASSSLCRLDGRKAGSPSSGYRFIRGSDSASLRASCHLYHRSVKTCLIPLIVFLTCMTGQWLRDNDTACTGASGSEHRLCTYLIVSTLCLVVSISRHKPLPLVLFCADPVPFLYTNPPQRPQILEVLVPQLLHRPCTSVCIVILWRREWRPIGVEELP